MPRLDGLDISTWNAKLDAKGAAAAGLKFVAVQVGWTSRQYKIPTGMTGSDGKWYPAGSLINPRTHNLMVQDSWYRRNMDALRADAPNVKRIHYYVPVNRPWREQMAEFAKVTGPILPGETSMFDLEYTAARELGWPALRDWMDAVEQRDQCKVFHYGEIFDQDDYPSRPKWPAHYGSNPATEAQRADMLFRYRGVPGLTVWQYTSKLTLPYVAGGAANTDGNKILDRARFDAAFKIKQQPVDDDDVYVDAKPDGVAVFHDGGGTVRWVTEEAEVAGRTVKSVGVDYFKHRVLIGALPIGDGLRAWSSADFMTVINGPVVGGKGAKGDTGDPGPKGASLRPGTPGILTFGGV